MAKPRTKKVTVKDLRAALDRAGKLIRSVRTSLGKLPANQSISVPTSLTGGATSGPRKPLLKSPEC